MVHAAANMCKGAQPAYRVDRITSEDQLGELQAEWNRLAGDVPFRRWEWLEASWRYLRTDSDRLLVLAVRDFDGSLIGLAPWYLHHSRLRSRVLRFLGDQACSEYLSILCAEGREADVGRCLANWLSGEGCRQWDALELAEIDGEDRAIGQLVQDLVWADHKVRRWPGATCWSVQLPGTWEEYVATLSKNRRKLVRRLCRRQFDSGRAVLRRVTGPEELQQAFEILQMLHQKRRQELGQPGVFAHAGFTEFLRTVSNRFGATGHLRMHWIELNGQPVATEFGLAGADTVYAYQSGMDPDQADEWPGWLDTIGSIKSAIEQGYRAYDLLRGSEAYKSHWRAAPRPLTNIRVASRSVCGQFQDRLWSGEQRGRALVRRGLITMGLRENSAGQGRIHHQRQLQ